MQTSENAMAIVKRVIEGDPGASERRPRRKDMGREG
jgi:hypothetical protein